MKIFLSGQYAIIGIIYTDNMILQLKKNRNISCRFKGWVISLVFVDTSFYNQLPGRIKELNNSINTCLNNTKMGSTVKVKC